MEFLLECIGFPPDFDVSQLVRRVRADGEPVAWRGPSGVHLRYALPGGVEVRLDREDDDEHWTLWPHYEVDHRLRVSVEHFGRLPDSPFDALLCGTANPPVPGAPPLAPELREDYPLATYVSDARRVPARLQPGHVLAVSIAGFALDVSYLGHNAGGQDPSVLEEPRGAWLMPLSEGDGPGGCMDVSLRIRRVRTLENPLSGEPVHVLETDAPGRPLELFVSRWQLAKDGLAPPRPGLRIEGVFMFTGRVSGGLPKRAPRQRVFG